ncbi:PAS and ANTAR domain-containing protein [Streptomyces broussonetiae]|uniref:PAS and ANTAR domain-containing protein n=1 Tax=Streptomyces broussonetiae TaxID=2686304 RepID=UPI00131D3654|nr:PAS and ANTAR domain-containing protein [Streptomyces broussonetiae]
MSADSIPIGNEADEPTGVFVYRVAENSWWWSDEMYRLYGYAPDSVEPTNELFHEHQHPDDRETVEKALAAVMADGKPFGCYHRIMDTTGAEHAVVLVADGRTDDTGSVVTLRGFVLDVTEPVARHARDLASEDISKARGSQEDIDLARGILMAQYGVAADVALRVLRRQSQYTNRKLRELAQDLVAAAPTPADEPQHDVKHRIGAVLYPQGVD